MDALEHEIRLVRQYVEAELSGEEASDAVVLVQKVGIRRSVGQQHDLYDVQCESSRWWVITNLTNMYSQVDFPEIDIAFTFHIGVMVRMHERSQQATIGEAPSPNRGAWRRWTQAVEAMDSANESEDFQAIGVMCREALLALVRDNVDGEWVVVPADRPKAADFKGWMAVIASSISVGRVRAYITSLCDRTWDLAVWLQHKVGATHFDAELVIDGTSYLLGAVASLINQHHAEPPATCPECGSYRVAQDGKRFAEGNERGWESWHVCAGCGWTSERARSVWDTLDPAAQLDDLTKQNQVADEAGVGKRREQVDVEALLTHPSRPG